MVDLETGECTAVELFVMVLGASNLTYVEATLTQRGAHFVASHMRGFEYFGGVPIATVCDQLRSGVSRPCRYEPQIQRTYEAMAVHYGTTVLPARPQHPRELFEQVERQHQQPLPVDRFAYCVFARATVNIDYHVAYDDHAPLGAVPTPLRARRRRRSSRHCTTIEVLYKNRRVASHARSYAKHQYTTVPEHMPDAHRKRLRTRTPTAAIRAC